MITMLDPADPATKIIIHGEAKEKAHKGLIRNIEFNIHYDFFRTNKSFSHVCYKAPHYLLYQAL